MVERLFTALQLHHFGPWAALDIAVLAVIFYQLLLLIRGTRAVNVIIAIAVIALLYVLSGPGLIEMAGVHRILGVLLLYSPLVIIVLFQHQIRQAMVSLGRNPFSSLLQKRSEDTIVEEIALAAIALSSKRLGALIVIEREQGLRRFSETGIELDALVSYDLLMNIFTRRSPLHDGAVIIADGRIRAASSYLPLTTTPSLSRTYGTRHRAAVGITEETDALAIVVSEERGVISLAEGGKIVGPVEAGELVRALTQALVVKQDKDKKPGGRREAAAVGTGGVTQ